ncbi:hypothetical protein LZK75_10000 [Rhizobium leguminosarum]|nr:hypothetical protein LZK75_10000 [Rhizobium leguminosarum]
MEQIGALSAAQRTEVVAIVDEKGQSSGLSSAQKWDVASIVAKMAGGFGAVLGVAAYFAVVNAAKDAAANIKAEETAQALLAQKEFTSMIAGRSGLVVPGTVVAFDVPGGCPAGWTEYASAAGRVIIGVDNGIAGPRRAFQEQGGSDSHQISKDELPANQVSIEGLASQSAVDRYSAGGRDYPVIVRSTGTFEVGGVGKPISIMPPYIALHYCRKA